MVSFKEFVVESRKDGISFTEKKVKNVITRVIATLSGHEAGSMTKLAKQYHSLELAIDKLKGRREEMNSQLRELVGSTFDPELDKFYTRVVQVSEFTVTLAKETKLEDIADKSEIDYEALSIGLKKLIAEALLPQAEELLKACTKTWKPEPKAPKLSVTKEVTEGVNQLYASVNKWMRSIKSILERLFAIFDKDFKKLQTLYSKGK